MTSACPGCSALLPENTGALDERLNASAACLQLCWELSAWTLEQRDAYFIHQLVVDAYACQHAKESNPRIGLVFGLLGLYLVFVRGKTGRDAQLAHAYLANKTREWPELHPTSLKAEYTIADVVTVQDPVERKERIKAWAQSVLETYSSQLSIIEELEATYLAPGMDK